MNPLLSLALAPLDLQETPAGAEVLIVLGAALTPDGRLGPALEERLRLGVEAWHRQLAPWLIVTGKYEASAMRDRALALGVPAQAILLEHTALTTRENAVFSSAIMRARGLRRALVVTQPYHRRRAIRAFRKVGVGAHALPFPSERVTSRQVLREYGALAVYRLRGWL